MHPHGVSRFAARSFLYAIALFLPFVSCTKGGPTDDSTGPPIPSAPPVIPLPRLAYEPRITSADSIARQASSIVMGQRNMLSYVSRTCEAAVSMLNGGTWARAGNSCWSKRTGADPGHGCSYTMWACLDGGQLDWTEVIDGRCPDGFGMIEYDDWIRMHAATSEDAQEGVFRVYRSGTDVVERAWTWTLRGDPATGDWAFYLGQIDETAPIARLTWSRPAGDSEVAEWLWYGYARWESEVASDGLAGSLTTHEWISARQQWRRLHEIRWAAGHGIWATFDSSGVATDDRSW